MLSISVAPACGLVLLGNELCFSGRPFSSASTVGRGCLHLRHDLFTKAWFGVVTSGVDSRFFGCFLHFVALSCNQSGDILRFTSDFHSGQLLFFQVVWVIGDMHPAAIGYTRSVELQNELRVVQIIHNPLS